MKPTQAPAGANDPRARVVAARRARLRYITDDRPGIRRIRAGHGFRYENSRGKPIADETVLARMRKLAIPPAWTDVWICPHPNGHLQATGRDTRGRKQYRYHERWHATRDETKFDHMIAFAKALPYIRRRVRRDLKLEDMPRDKVLATVVRLLETTLIRVGNDEYTRANGSFGLTTLRNPHARVRRDEIHFEFRGKGGKHRSVTVRDPRLARIVRRCQEIPGQELFQYLDEDGKRHAIGSVDVNAYLQEAGGGPFTAKDFRTWAATLLAAETLRKGSEAPPTKRCLTACIEQVASRLGNTPAICKKCYIHPGVLDAYLAGTLDINPGPARKGRSSCRLDAAEAALLRWLRRQK